MSSSSIFVKFPEKLLILYCPRSKFLLNSESIKYSCASSINLFSFLRNWCILLYHYYPHNKLNVLYDQHEYFYFHKPFQDRAQVLFYQQSIAYKKFPMIPFKRVLNF